MIVGEFKDKELVHQVFVLCFRDEDFVLQDESLAQDECSEIFNGAKLATIIGLGALQLVMTGGEHFSQQQGAAGARHQRELFYDVQECDVIGKYVARALESRGGL